MTKTLLLLTSALFIFAGVATAQGTSTATTPKPATTPTPAKKPPIFRATKDQIKEVQTMLKGKSLYSGEATGQLNDDTRAGIKIFQKGARIRETGTLNRATLEKMGIKLTDKQKEIPVTASSLKPDPPKEPKTTSTASTKTTSAGLAGTPDTGKKPAPFRANAEQIKAAQKILKNGKMYDGEETGKFDDEFRDGLGKYQEANNIKVTRTLNAVTLEKMGIKLTDAQKANVAATAAYNAAQKN